MCVSVCVCERERERESESNSLQAKTYRGQFVGHGRSPVAHCETKESALQ